MAAEIELLLRSLHARSGETTTTTTQYAVQDAVDIIGHIRQICLGDVTAEQAALCCTHLFHKDNGAMAFVKKTAKLGGYAPCKVSLLETLVEFLRDWESHLQPYLLDIKDGCLSTFTCDRDAKVKAAALTFLIDAIQLSVGSRVGDELHVGKMMDKFFSELITASKHGVTVKQQIYHLLGTLTEVYPEYVIDYSDRLVELYLRTLKVEMTAKTRKPEMSVIAGCMRGLTHLLVNFTQSAAEESKHSYEIYKYARMALDPLPGEQYQRYQMPSAALMLLAKHGAQFAPYLLDEYEMMYKTLLFWSRHGNRDVLHCGIAAMRTFLQQVSESLVTRSKQGMKDSAVFKFFICEFREVIDSPGSTTKEVSVAIQGYGYLAAPCKTFLSSDDVKSMFNEMIERSEQIFFSQQENTEEELMNLASFLQALASIVAEVDEVSETFVWSLERLVVMMMEIYPKLQKKWHYDAFIAIAKVLIALIPSHATFTAFLTRVVYQGLIRSCSHQVVLEAEETASPSVDVEEAMRENQRITYADYIPLWSALLSCYNMKELIHDDIGHPELCKLSAAIYDELISGIITMLKRLDLTSTKDGDSSSTLEKPVPGTSSGTASPEAVTADPLSGLAASTPQDFTIFINLVDLTRELLLTRHTDQFLKWVFTFGHEIILQSSRLPLVSGFYKLLALCMQICRETAYFKEVECGSTGIRLNRQESIDSAVDESEPMEVDDDVKSDLPQREACFLLFSKVTGEVLLRLKQYKDDLLASCLTFVLSVPSEIAVVHITGIVSSLQLSFELGRSYLVMANVALDALEYYSRTLPADVIDTHYQQILPSLDPFLRTGPHLGDEDESTLSLTSTKPSKKTGKKKIPKKLLKQKKADAMQTYETQLTQVRQRCVVLLGSLGGRINNALLTRDPSVIAKQAIAWDTVKHLKFDLPFIDIKPIIYFDPFLGRIVELATTSSDRQTKVAACELLHGLVLYMLGRATQQPGSRVASEPMEALYRRVFPVILQLACDVEQVSQQLFEPLMFQLIHWFTNNKKFESEDTMALLDTLMDGVVSPTDTARRDFSAKCIREFLIWSIKQVSKQKMEKSPLNIESLLKRLYSLAAHPSAFKRLGSSLAFNNIYDVFREEESLVDRYIFEILVHYVESLALAHHDDKSLGTQEQCKLVLGHLERIIKAKKDKLNPTSKTRVNPKNWNEATLQLAVHWLLLQCGRPHTECRHACMNLVSVLAPCIPNFETSQDFFAAYLKDGKAKYYIDRFEAANYKGVESGLLRAPTIDKVSKVFGLKAALSWFDTVLATLDCYTWVFVANLLKPTDVLLANQGTVIFRVLDHFFEKLALNDISGAAKLFISHEETVIYTPSEVDQYNHAKCTIIVRILNFLCCLLANEQNVEVIPGDVWSDCLWETVVNCVLQPTVIGFNMGEVEMMRNLPGEVIPGDVWSDCLWETVVNCVLQPTVIGFNMGEVEMMRNLPGEVEQFLQLVFRSLPANIQKNLVDCIAAKLTKGGCNLFGKLPLDLRDSSADFLHLRHLVAGFQQLQRIGLLISALGKRPSDSETLARTVMNTVFQSLTYDDGEGQRVVPLSPAAQQLAESLIDLAFLLGLPASVIIDLFLNDTRLLVTSTNSSHHGITFYATYRATLNTHLVTMAATFIPSLMQHASKQPVIVGNVLSSLLDQISCDHALCKKMGSSVVALVLKEGAKINTWWKPNSPAEIKLQALTLLAKVIVIDSKAVSDVNKEWFSDVFSMYCEMLTDTTTALGFKCQVLDLLVFFTSLPEKQTEALKERMDRFVSDNFPMRSSEYDVGSPRYNDCISVVDKILSAMELSGSLMLLELVISIMCREEQHIHEDAIQAAFVTFVKRMPRDRQKLAVDVPYKIYCNEGGFPDIIRRSSLERVGLSLLHRIHASALIEFYLDHIKDIMTTVEAKAMKGSDSEVEMQMTTKLCAFQLLEVMYSRLPKSEVSSMDSHINNKYCNGVVTKGNEMTNAACKCANAVRSEDIRGETTLLGLRRQYHCAAYNALIAVLSCTQTQLKFYSGLLFSDNLPKGQFLFENILDVDHHYEFSIQMEKPFERRKRFVSIRSEARDRRLQEAAEAAEDYVSSSVHYLASHCLTNSSLSTDVSNFDFGTSAVSASVYSGLSLSGSIGRHSSSKLQSLRSQESEPAVMVSDDYVEMEMDELNQNECMAALTALLQHMHRNNITPRVEMGSSPTEMPPWMLFLHRKMNESTTPVNIKLFIAKLIVNTQMVFAGYAKFWLAPLTQLVVSGETGGEGIHYFMSDLVITMLAWNSYAIPEDSIVGRAMATRLCEYLMGRCHNQDRQVLRSNLELIKTLVEVWKSRIDVPTRVIHQNFSKPNVNKDVVNATGVQLLGVVLANKLPPYAPGCGVEKEKYFQHLAMNMMHPYKAVSAASAEIVGMALKVMAEKEKGDAAADWRNMYLDNIAQMLKSLQAKRSDTFITCIHHLTNQYPPAAEKFISNVLFMLPKMHGELHTYCLEIITNCVDHVENVFIEMKDKGLVNSMEHHDETMQKVAVKLVRGMLPRLKPDQLLYLLSAVEKVATQSNAAGRHEAYDVFMWVYDNYRDDESPEAAEILTITKDCLLRGLSDPDLENRIPDCPRYPIGYADRLSSAIMELDQSSSFSERNHCKTFKLLVENFWSTGDRLPGSTVERLVAMLETMYSPHTEHYYLSYATSLLLRATVASPDFNRMVFEHPLSECKFEDYNVVSSWRQRHMAMTPLFVATQASQSMSSTVDDSLGTGQVRATQETYQFTPTQEQGGGNTYNWLTQTSMDTYDDLSLSLATMETQSPLLFTIGRRPKAGARGGGEPGPPGGKASAPAAKTDEVDSGNSDILRLKRRFLKDQGQAKLYFINRNTRLSRMREEAQAERKKRRENQVTMYRKYRIGDLPDIQIKYSALIAPLQALAQCDASLARILFSSIFQAIAADIEEVETYTKINESLNSMLANSTRYSPHFIGCILDIAYNFPRQVKLDASSLNTACVTSLQQPLGILVLEEQLIREGDDYEKPAKKARGGPVESPDTSLWIELARLYKSIDEYDVLCGIFSSRFHKQPNTTSAISAEMSGDYQTAINRYDEASRESFNEGEDAPSEVEQDFWDESRLQCYAQLTQWDMLEQFIEQTIDEQTPPRLDVVWDSTYYQEQYLPQLIQCKLKLLFEKGEGQQGLLNFIERAMQIPDHKDLLENRYSTELALIYMWQEQYERASIYTDQSITAFLQNWSSMDSLMYSSRQNMLQQLQSLVELQEFLKFIKQQDNFKTRKPSEKLVSRWLNRKPDLILDPVQVWDDVVINRCVYLDRVAEKLESAGVVMATDDSSIFDKEQVMLRLSLADSAWQQDNFPVALKQMKATHYFLVSIGRCAVAGPVSATVKLEREPGNDEANLIQMKACEEDERLSITWTHTYAKTHNRRSKIANSGISFDERIQGLTGTLEQLEKYRGSNVLSADPALCQQQGLLQGEAYHVLIKILQEKKGLHLDKLSAEQADSLVSLSKADSETLEEVINGLIESGYDELKQGVKLADEDECTSGNLGDGMISDVNAAHLALVKYCDDFLHQCDEHDGTERGASITCLSIKQFPCAMVHSLLTAMKNGSLEARQRFPRLLQIIELHKDSISNFKKKVSEIPCWMFLDWVSQITAILDKPESPAIHKLLLNMAQQYPQAVVYPFKLSSDGYSFAPDANGRESLMIKKKLEELLTQNKLIDVLISALEQFGQPNALFSDYMNDDLTKLLERKVSERSERAILQKYGEMYDELIGMLDSAQDLHVSQTSTQGSVPIKIGLGRYRQKFAKEYGKQLEKEFGRNGMELVSMSLKEFNKKKDKLLCKMHDDRNTTLEPPRKLNEYSEWLASFKASDFDYELEIPGQYTGKRKPLPEYHTKIASFDPRVLVLKSLRVPKRLTVRGNDEREYPFLVKGGEDLRQDLRIEQLFVIMNDIYRQDPATRQRDLQLRTYQVIPMTARVGMIEWMNKTMPMKDFLYSAMTPEESKFVKSNEAPRHDHFKFIGGGGPANYDNACKETEVAFRRRQEMVPGDLFRRGLMNLSASLEAYFMLRNNAAVSHAVICISQYILGIGDRHLSNFMIALDTGFVCGIDFGYSFGTATQFLRIPELMPFRYTRQIRNLTMPLCEKGLVEGTMIHALRALRNHSDLLLATMDVFIKEPSVDWQKLHFTLEAYSESNTRFSLPVEFCPL